MERGCEISQTCDLTLDKIQLWAGRERGQPIGLMRLYYMSNSQPEEKASLKGALSAHFKNKTKSSYEAYNRHKTCGGWAQPHANIIS